MDPGLSPDSPLSLIVPRNRGFAGWKFKPSGFILVRDASHQAPDLIKCYEMECEGGTEHTQVCKITLRLGTKVIFDLHSGGGRLDRVCFQWQEIGRFREPGCR